MTVTVKQVIETVGGKPYPMTVTKQKGYQELEIDGETVAVELVTICEGAQGRSVCFAPIQPEVSPEERAANRKIIVETATKAMIDQGIW